jgi:hypothetical protein
MMDYHFFDDLLRRRRRGRFDEDHDEERSYSDDEDSSDDGYYGTDDDPDYDEPEPEPFNSWFVKCTRLYDMGPMRDRTAPRLRYFPPQRDCLEFEVRDNKSLDDVIEALGQEQVANMVLQQGLQRRAVSRKIRGRYDSWDISCVIWLSPSTFVVSGRQLWGIETEGWLNLLLQVTIKTGDDDDDDGDEEERCEYRFYSPERACSNDTPNKVLSWIDTDRNCSWETVSLSSGANARPFSSSAWALKELIGRDSDGQSRVVEFGSAFHGLTRDQWEDVLRSFHPQTWLCFFARASPWTPFLLDALRRGASPERIKIRRFGSFEPIEGLMGALAGCVSVTGLSVEISQSRDVIDSLLDAVEANAYLNTLEIRSIFTLTEWKRLWEVAASHSTLSTVRVPFRGFFIDSSSRTQRFETVQLAVQRNVQLTGIETFEDRDNHCYRMDYDTRILPLVRWNRIIHATNAVTNCSDASWRVRLFASSLCHQCRAGTGTVETLSGCLLLLRRNVDLIQPTTKLDFSNNVTPVDHGKPDECTAPTRSPAPSLKRKHQAMDTEIS